jgi:hypothetical protein
MKRVLVLGLSLAMFSAAHAAEFNRSEVDVISVIPRSSDVKPIPMSLPAGGRPIRNEIRDRQKQAPGNQIAIDAAREKTFSGANREKLLQNAHPITSNPETTKARGVENYLH